MTLTPDLVFEASSLATGASLGRLPRLAAYLLNQHGYRWGGPSAPLRATLAEFQAWAAQLDTGTLAALTVGDLHARYGEALAADKAAMDAFTEADLHRARAERRRAAGGSVRPLIRARARADRAWDAVVLADRTAYRAWRAWHSAFCAASRAIEIGTWATDLLLGEGQAVA